LEAAAHAASVCAVMRAEGNTRGSKLRRPVSRRVIGLIVGHRAAGEPQTRGDLPEAQVLLGVEPQQLEDRTHG
jgi:hypothetical protein